MVATASITQESSRKLIKTPEFTVEINDAGEGYPIIMLHGTGPGANGWSNFAPNIVPLSEKYRVIGMTMPGWGQSTEIDPSKEPRTKAHARAVKQVMDELKLPKAAFVGNSMGGGITQQFAIDYPDRISHFITMGSGAPGVNMFAPQGMGTEGLRIIRETYEDPSPANFRRLVTVMVYDSSFVTDELCELRSKLALANPTHLANWLKPAAPLTGQDTLAELAKIKVPALIIHGRDDRVVPIEGSLRLNSIMQDSRLLVFNHCGHWAQIEHAEEFNWVVDNFVAHNLSEEDKLSRKQSWGG